MRCRARGSPAPDTIIAADVGAAKLERAKAFGATHAVDAGAADVVDQVRALTGGRGADHVFEAAGHPSAFRLSVEAVRPAGQVVWLGKINVNQDVSFRWGSLMGEKRIVRSSYGDALPKRDFPWLCSLWLDGKLELDALITRRIAPRRDQRRLRRPGAGRWHPHRDRIRVSRR